MGSTDGHATGSAICYNQAVNQTVIATLQTVDNLTKFMDNAAKQVNQVDRRVSATFQQIGEG